MELYTVLVVLVHAALLGIGCWLIVIDVRLHRLPNRIVLPMLGTLAVLAVVDAIATGRADAMIRAACGLLILACFYAMLRLISQGGMGGGDVKLAAVIGLVLGWHGWQVLVVGAVVAFALGALYALLLMLFTEADRSTRIAFGPWMILGAVVGIAGA